MIIHNDGKGDYTEDKIVINTLLNAMKEKNTISKHETIVKIIPDDYNSWNELKKFLINHPDNFNHQLKVVESALLVNPKSYQTWHHRTYMMKHFTDKKEEALERENLITTYVLKHDTRNFHCWNYRMMLFNGKNDDIEADAYNYSYLHHHPDSHDPKSLVYTDPLDTAGWEFLRTKREAKRFEKNVYLKKFNDYYTLTFKNPISGEIKITALNYEKIINKMLKTKYIKINDKLNADKVTIQAENINVELNDTKENCDFINDILELEPNSRDALLYELDYISNSKDRENRIKKLISVDPLREHYYLSLNNLHYDLMV